MPEYDYIDKSINGLIQGLNNEIDGRFVAAEQVEFGTGVFGYIGEDKKVGIFHLDVGKLVYSGEFVDSNVINVTVNGGAISPVTWDSTHIITMNLVVAAIDALEDVEAVLDPDDGSNLTILIRTKFVDATVSSVVTLGGSQATATATYHSGQVFMGCSTFVQNSPGVYELYDAVSVLKHGMVTIVPIEDISALEDAFIDIAGIDKGSWSNAGLQVDARYLENATATGFTVLEVKGKTNAEYAEYF